jgi:hypothetical protein
MDKDVDLRYSPVPHTLTWRSSVWEYLLGFVRQLRSPDLESYLEFSFRAMSFYAEFIKICLKNIPGDPLVASAETISFWSSRKHPGLLNSTPS